MNYGFKPTTHGEALIAACMDLGAPLKITRAAVGSGLAGGSLANTHALVHYIADADIADRRHEGNQLFLSIQYRNDAHPELGDFILSEFIVYAQNPETGQETDFLYATLGDSRQPVPSFRGGFPASVWTFPVVLTVSGDLQVTITASPGLVTSLDLQDAIDQLKLELMTNELTLPLETSSGEALLSSSGTPLLAAYRPDGKSAAAMAAVAELEGRLAKQLAQTAEGLAADCASASSLARAYADGRVLALERAVDEQLADQAAETEENIRAAKAEAVSAASADAAEKANAAKAEAVAAAGTAAVEKYKIVEKRLIYRIANDISKHDNSADSHPGFLASKSKMAPPIVAPTIPEDVQDILDDYIDILDRGTTPKEEF